MKSWPAFAVVVAVQAIAQSPRELARLSVPLQPTQIGVILKGSREAIADRTFTLSFPDRDEGPQILMRGDGRPARMRTVYGISGGTVGADGSGTQWHDDFVDVVDYTGAPAIRCDGSAIAGELVITYQHRASTNAWTTAAATTAVDWNGAPVQIGEPIFGILSGTTPVSSASVPQTRGGHLARAFTAPFVGLAGRGLGDSPASAMQSLWIDVDSLLPVMWEVSVGSGPSYELVFNYNPLDLSPPEAIEPPHCIP
jgi:hypothetical protein